MISTAFAQSPSGETTSNVLKEFITAIPFWIAALAVVIVFYILSAAVQKIVVYRITQKMQHELNKEGVILIGRTVKFFIVLLGVIIAFAIVGINIAAIIGFLSLGVGFALKDLLSNFIAGVVILTQKKFHIGDTVKIGDIVGKVLEIETRTTEIQAFDGTVHIIPNADLLTSVVQNYTAKEFRRIEFSVGVHYDTPLKEVVDLTLKSVMTHELVVPEPKTVVIVSEFGDSSINLIVRFWIESAGSKPWPSILSEVMQKLKKDFDTAGITIPFPMRTLTLDSYDRNILRAFNLPDEKPKFSFGTGGSKPVKIETPPVQQSEQK